MTLHPTPSEPLAPVTAQPRDDQIDVFGMTHPGLRRRENQDHFLLCSLHKTMRVRGSSLPNPELLEIPSERLAFFGMVADGVGATEGGEAASRAAIEAVAAYATHAMRCYYGGDPENHEAFLHALGQAARDCQETVLARGREHPEYRGLATTLTMGIGVWPWVYVLHIGDSRMYRLRGERLERLTRDQTMAQELVDSGVLPPERAAHSRFANVLASSLGGELQPDLLRFDNEPDDVFLLCTDGLTHHVSDEAIRERLLRMTSAEQVCRALVQDALDGGGSDNVTVVVGRAVVGRRSPP